MAYSQESFIRLLMDFEQQQRQMQECLLQAQAVMAQSRLIAADALRIHVEAEEATAQAYDILRSTRAFMVES
ncbi:MAG: hypothetical protein ICV83_10415 [Cytophagales bacterium]|nr:hypothetical protein [Cytophagales bacterium]